MVVGYNFNKLAALNETDGSIKDFSQYGNHGSGYGATTWTGNGKRGGAYSLNGTDSAIKIGRTPSANYSISLRFYRDSFGADGYETLIGGPGGFELDTKAGAVNTPILRLYSR